MAAASAIQPGDCNASPFAKLMIDYGKPYDDGVRGFGLNEGEQFLKKGGAGTHEDGFAGKGHAAPGIRNRNAGAFLAVVYGEVLHKNPLRKASVCPGMKAALRVAESPVEGIP